jgi:hypothetical protein
VRIQNEMLWANIQPTEPVSVVFWQDDFDPFVSFTRRKRRATMAEVMQTTSDELKEAGFTPDFIAKIIATLDEWAERLLNPDTAVTKELKEAVDTEDEDNEDEEDEGDFSADDVLSFFFDSDNQDGNEVEYEDE